MHTYPMHLLCLLTLTRKVDVAPSVAVRLSASCVEASHAKEYQGPRLKAQQEARLEEAFQVGS